MKRWIQPDQTALLIVDVQDKLFRQIERPSEVMQRLQMLIRGCQILNIPIFVTEQYPQGLGTTIDAVKDLLPADQTYHSKTTFSCCADAPTKEALLGSQKKQWIVAGIEAHVCILQSAKALLEEGMEVIVPNDAISARSIYDFSTAIAEMRDEGVRITSVETILFECVRDSKSSHFKALSELIKSCANVC